MCRIISKTASLLLFDKNELENYLINLVTCTDYDFFVTFSSVLFVCSHLLGNDWSFINMFCVNKYVCIRTEDVNKFRF